MNLDLEQVLEDAWDKVREKFHYPALPFPRLAPINNAEFKFSNLQVTLCPNLLEGFTEHGITLEEATEGILAHEITHYMRFPGSILRSLRLVKQAITQVDQEKAAEFVRLFDEVRTNIYTFSEYGHSKTPQMRHSMLPIQHPYENLLNGVYQLRWDYDMGMKFSEEEEKIVYDINKLDLLNRKREVEVFEEFVNILKDYEPKEDEDKKDDEKCEGGGGSGGKGMLERMMEAVKGILSEALGGGEKNDPESDQKVDPTQGPPPPGPGMYSEDQIKEGKAIFAKECETPDEYENIIRILLGENEEKPTGKKGEGEGVVPGGNSAGTSRENFTTALNVYTALARNFSIPIKEKAKEMGSGQFPSSQTEFSIGDPISSLNPYATPGIYPGLSVRMVYKGQRTFSGSSDTPDCILVIDNSGSMTDPNRLVSLATLTTTVIANAYLANGSQVAGYSFGGGNHVLPFTSNREDIHRSARRYTGGGTIFNSSYVEALIEGRSSVDIAVLSDMDIDNLSHFVSYISELPQTNRIHLLSIKDNRCYDDQYRRSLNHRFENNPNVVVRLIESQDDIGSVTMGDLSESFGM